MNQIWEQCESLLRTGSEEAYESLYEILFLDVNQETIQQDNALFYLQSMSYIWNLEKKISEETYIFSAVACVKEAAERYQRIKFVLRRIEQLMPRELCVQGLQELLTMQISVPAFVYVVKKEVRKSYQTLLMTAAYLESCGADRMRDELLEWGMQFDFAEYEKEDLAEEKTGDGHKFCFIVCTNSQLFVEECFQYIAALHVPEGYTVETLAVWEATSMTAGYNEGMQASDAAFKIYLHQDVFIRNKWFLFDLLQIFGADAGIGMVGLVGSEHLPQDGTMWHGKRIGCIYSAAEVDVSHIENHLEPIEALYRPVEALDGMLLATRYDIPFREDLFDGWDFYDISACMEYRRAGYQCVVAGQNTPWCIHDCGHANLEQYERYRQIFIKEYGNEDSFSGVEKFWK